MKTLGIFLLPVLLAFGHVSAQNHVNGYAGTTIFGDLFLVDQGGMITSLTVGTSSNFGVVMDRTNTLLIVCNLDGILYLVDPVKAAVVGALATGLTSPYDLAVDQNGDCFVAGNDHLWKVDGQGGVTTVTTLLPSPCSGGMAIDIDTGDVLVQSLYGSPNSPLMRVSRDGSSIAVMGIGVDARYGITQDIRTGDLFVGSCCGDLTPFKNIYAFQAGRILPTVWLGNVKDPAGVYSLRADRASAAVQQLILGAFHQPSRPDRGGGLYAIDLGTQGISRLTTLMPSLLDTEILYRRNLHGLSTGRGKWTLGIHVPEDAGLPYQMLVGTSGVRPGVNLADGRRVNLTLDFITLLGIYGSLFPVVTGSAGILDASGRGAANLDLSFFTPMVNGVRLWFLVLTLDPLAPGGIKTITDPLVFEVEGL